MFSVCCECHTLFTVWPTTAELRIACKNPLARCFKTPFSWEHPPPFFFHFFFMPAYTYLNLCLCGCTANSSVVFPSKYESEEYLLRYLSLFAITCNVKNGSWPWGLLNVFLMFFFFHVATCCATIFPHNDESKQVDVCVWTRSSSRSRCHVFRWFVCEANGEIDTAVWGTIAAASTINPSWLENLAAAHDTTKPSHLTVWSNPVSKTYAAPTGGLYNSAAWLDALR